MILVGYFTKGGASEQYANEIAETLKTDGLDIEITNLAQGVPDITNFDIIILGTGVRMYRVYGLVQVFLHLSPEAKPLVIFLLDPQALHPRHLLLPNLGEGRIRKLQAGIQYLQPSTRCLDF